ncbi:MAG: hypothetical protein ABEI57_02035 [Halapricum sp.]
MSRHTSRSGRQLRTQNRAVSEVIGAILIFALLFLVLVLIQVNAVPAANKQVEFEHSKRVTQDFQSLQEGIYRAGTSGSDVAVPVETGVTYPPRFFLLNPGPAVGSLRTTGTQWVNISNARAGGNAGDYWTGDPIDYTTTGIAYTPNYNELANAGTLYWEHSMLYRRYENDNVYFDDPTSVVDGRQIRLTLLDGQIPSNGLSTSVELAPISTQQRTVTIEDDGDPVTLTLTTRLHRSEWQDALADEPYAKVTDFDVAAGTVNITLDENQTYDLRISKVRIGTSITPGPGARYITDVDGNGTAIAENTTRRITVEVRDEFDNPVSNVPVRIDSAPRIGTITPIQDNRTNSDGQVTFRYTAPKNVDGSQTVEIGTAMPDGTDPGNTTDALERARIDLTVLDTDNSGGVIGNTTGDGVSGINPSVDAVQLTGVTTKGSSEITLDFYNNATTTMTLSKARLLFYIVNSGNPGLSVTLTKVDGQSVSIRTTNH